MESIRNLPSEMNPRKGQPGRKLIDEVTAVIANYKIILDTTGRMNKIHPSQHAQSIYATIRSIGIPKLRMDLEQAADGSAPEKLKLISEKDKKELCKALNGLILQTMGKVPEGCRGSLHDESALVQLLYMKEQHSWQSTLNKPSEPEGDWGRLGALSGHLKELSFRPYKHDKNGRYWPGLPNCIMTSFVTRAASEISYLSLSASSDRLWEAEKAGKALRECRDRRLERIKEGCDDKAKAKIAELDSMREDILKNTADRRDPKQRSRLPVIACTWHPDGSYLRACALCCRRFRFRRPQAAQAKERPAGGGAECPEYLFPTTACAEWEEFLRRMKLQSEERDFDSCRARKDKDCTSCITSFEVLDSA